MDKLTIINKALLKCGLPLAAALNDCDWNAAMVFDACRDEVLRGAAWNFAIKYATLSQAGTPIHGYERSYSIPTDNVRIIDVRTDHSLRGPQARHAVVGKFLYANVSPCCVRYVSNTVDISTWPSDFCDVVSSRIALEIAPLSAQTANLQQQLAQLYASALALAQANDAKETCDRVPLDESIYLARAGAPGFTKKVR